MGGVGAVSGAIGGALDFNAASEQAKKKRPVLTYAYIARTISLFAITALTLGVAISGSGPYLRMLMARTSNKVALVVLSALEAFATRLATDQLLKMMRAGLAHLAWVGLIITGIIWLLEPEVIESWCEKSVFRKLKNNKAFNGVADELIELEAAFNKMIGG